MNNIRSIDDIFSLRLVIADFYMAKPVLGLDPCYSEFRGKDIKKVPIIRIFGSSADGGKACMHVHGVFPYFYIPYEQKEFDSINKAAHQIAIHLDKAINISLGQASSGTQHVFKVQLVKGIPIYGYHHAEHQYLKIYMFNPRYVRKAATLLQNGAIMNKNIHPHESHVPYILQFMIDYNLYGMSLVHVPLEIVQFRCTTDAQRIPFKNIKTEQILDCNLVQKVTLSAIEVDVNSNFILNRFQLINITNISMNAHINPGIESIWNDEKMRRQKLKENNDNEEIPTLEIPPREIRLDVEPSESEIFHKRSLIMKLSTMASPSPLSDLTLDSTSSSVSINKPPSNDKNQKRNFNLTKLLENAIYPEECTQHNKLINASYIENHLSNSGFPSQYNKTNVTPSETNIESNKQTTMMSTEGNDNVEDHTIVDEQLIMNLSQNQYNIPLDATLREQDIELLDVLQQLEENLDENHVDLDSTLAPLTQSHDIFMKTTLLTDKTFVENVTDNIKNDINVNSAITNEINDRFDNEDDNDNVEDYSIIMDNIDDIIMNLTQSNNCEMMPQMDGVDDSLKTPTKSKAKRSTLINKPITPKTPERPCSVITKSPLHSPRTPKSSLHKYNALPLKIINTTITREIEDSSPGTSKQIKSHCLNHKVGQIVQQKNLPILSIDKNRKESVTDKKCGRQRRNPDKTFITCALTPKRQKQTNTKNLKVYNIRRSSRILMLKENPQVQLDIANGDGHEIVNKSLQRIRSQERYFTQNVTPKRHNNDRSQNNNLKKLKTRQCRVLLKKLKTTQTFKEDKIEKEGNGKRETLATKCKYIEENNEDSKLINNSKDGLTTEQNVNVAINGESPENVVNVENNCDDSIHMMSFYENSFLLHSPPVFSRDSSPVVTSMNCSLISSNYLTQSNDGAIVIPTAAKNTIKTPPDPVSILSPGKDFAIITPIQLPPNRDEVLANYSKHQIPEHTFPQPFYNNPDDVTKSKEIGNIVLHIPSNKINDLEEFQSDEMQGLAAWRRQQLIKIGGSDLLNRLHTTEQMLEYFANEDPVVIEPSIDPPSRHEVKLWLKANDYFKRHDEEDNVKSNIFDVESPIKVKRQKGIMMLQMNNENELLSESSIRDNSNRDNQSSLHIITANPLCMTSMNEHDLIINIDEKKEEKLSTSVNVNEKNVRIPNFKDSTNYSGIDTQAALDELDRLEYIRKMQMKTPPPAYDANLNFSHITFDNSYGFKVALDNLRQAKSNVEFTYLTIMTMEVFVSTRRDLLPNPEFDEIRCIFYAIENSRPNCASEVNDYEKMSHNTCGCIIVQSNDNVITGDNRSHDLDKNIDIAIVQSEVEAFDALLTKCRHCDPDIYAGYEVEMSSWGYIIERAKCLGIDIAPLLSRVPTQKARDFIDEDRDQFTDLDVEMKLCGRILLDVWRLMRSEIALTSYTFENVMYHILHKRYSCHSYRTLTEWFHSSTSRWIVLEYYLDRVRGILDLLNQLDLLGRTSEMAKLIGIQFYEVLSRGSQYRVESMMLRMAKPKNFVCVSPSVQQRAHMRAPEYLPLIMEPLSRFYSDPVIVLDFQSLYPSVIIAYNYCFSTCLGRIEHLGQCTPFEFGASHLRISPKVLYKLIDQDLVNISPCGVVFVKSCVREGILPRMLTEILDTRQMVKQSMKLHKTNSALQRVLHSRQLGLKLMANVTYGYTAANFSGRMPAVEVGDSVVSKGRELLEKAIKLVETNDKWNAKVIYGDTDSMFVLVPGRNRQTAFNIGNEIADTVTRQYPYPVKLKLEKIYQPCILQTKKRYVGYMYEAADQQEPVYEAKGIETVRRDGCPIVARILEKVLRILFETADVSQVKRYVCRQFTKILSGRANLQDLIFAKEFRGLNGYKPTACVPALELTRKWVRNDPRCIPRRGERVPFVIICGPPGLPLIRLVRHPHEVLKDEGLKINAIYYITKAIIPPLNRCLLLIGADVTEWFSNLPRRLFSSHTLPITLNNDNAKVNNLGNKLRKTTISQFFSTADCILDCGRPTKHDVCQQCQQDKQRSVILLQMKLTKCERAYVTTKYLCQYCCQRIGNLNCNSLDCPVLYVLEARRRDLQEAAHIHNILQQQF